MTQHAVVGRALCKELGRAPKVVRAVDGLDFELARGSCTALLGPNGAGKTTTIEMIVGLTAPTSGTLTVLDSSWGEDRAGLTPRIGVVLQDSRLPPRIRVREQLELFGSLGGRRGPPIDALIDLVRLREVETVHAGDLSGGQRQRLALALALVGEPELLVLDEPTSGLDPNSRRDVWSIIEELKRRGSTIILSTHAMDEAARLADRILFVHQGKVVADGTVRELVGRLPFPQTLELRLEPPPDPEIWARHGATVRDGTVRIATSDLRATLATVFAELGSTARIVSIASHAGTLDDVFAQLTGRSLDGSREPRR